MYLFIIKALLGKLPSCISNLLTLHINSRCTRSGSCIRLTVPRLLSKFGKSAFSAYAPWACNKFQNVINLDTLPTLPICLNVIV